MRKVNYTIKTAEGKVTTTTSYTTATANGSRILGTFLTEVDEQTPEQKQKAREHAERVRKALAEKKRV